jgi:hypothetical protein
MFNDKLVIFTNKNTIYQSKLKLLEIFGQSRFSSTVGCNNIGEKFNTLLFKSGLKRAMSTLLSDFLNFSPKLEQM